MIKELHKFNDGVVPGKPVVIPINPGEFTNDYRRKALDAVNLIDEKLDDRIKGRSCANGSKQIYYLKEFESVASHTFSLEGLMVSLMLAAYEGCHFISFDAPGAFLQAEMLEEKLVLLKMKNIFVDMMCQINPEHKKNIQYEKSEKVLYMRVTRDIYGCIEASS